MDLGLKDRRALVTAASRGLGRACAEALVAEGAHVVISSRDQAAIEATARDIGAARGFVADMAKAADVEALVSRTGDQLGGLDVLIVNAGGPPAGTFQQVPLESWEPAFELTVMSAVRIVHEALPLLKRSEQGRVVFITSVSVRQPLPNLALSNALRGAVTGLAKTLALELAADRITFNCVAPDAILTDRIRHLVGGAGGDLEENLKRRAAQAPMKRFGEPAEFAAACVFLCSRQAAYITGQTLGVDGGSLAGVH